MTVDYNEITKGMISRAYETMPLKMLSHLGEMIVHWEKDIVKITDIHTDEDLEKFICHVYNTLTAEVFGLTMTNSQGKQRSIAIYVSDDNRQSVCDEVAKLIPSNGVCCSRIHLEPIDDDDGGIRVMHKLLGTMCTYTSGFEPALESFIDNDCTRILLRTLGIGKVTELIETVGFTNWTNLRLLAKNATILSSSALSVYFNALDQNSEPSIETMISRMMVGNCIATSICDSPVGMCEIDGEVYDIWVGVHFPTTKTTGGVTGVQPTKGMLYLKKHV